MALGSMDAHRVPPARLTTGGGARYLGTAPLGRGGRMTDRTKVAAVGELGEGQARTVEVNGKSIAVFNVAGRYYAIDNLCPHRGGPLGEGDVEGQIVVCPWHGWRWDVTTGANANNPAVRVSCYPVTVDQGTIFVAAS